MLSLGLGQLLSLLICGTAVTSGLLQNESVRIPTGKLYNILAHCFGDF